MKSGKRMNLRRRGVYLAHLLTVAAPSSEPRVRNTEEEESALLRPREGGRG